MLYTPNGAKVKGLTVGRITYRPGDPIPEDANIEEWRIEQQFVVPYQGEPVPVVEAPVEQEKVEEIKSTILFAEESESESSGEENGQDEQEG